MLSRLRQGVPDRLLVALGVALVYVGFLTMDQMHWWDLKPDYTFGWLVPMFVVYIVYDRWQKMRQLLAVTGPSPLPGWLERIFQTVAGLALGGGLALFVLGALYRAGVGHTQPGTLVLALSFPAVLLGMLYFNVPAGRTVMEPPPTLWGRVQSDARLRVVGLFIFPAFIWLLSAPMLSAVETAINLALMRKVVTVVFAVFNLLGFMIVQQGNVLLLPQGSVGVADACSGIRSLTGCLFAGSFMAAIYLNRFWQKALLIALALGLAFFTNLLRSLFLTSWAYAYGSQAIEGDLHDATGYAVMVLTTAGLFLLLPLFKSENWYRWLRL